MTLPPLQPGPHYPQPRPGNSPIEHAETPQDRGFRRLLAATCGRPEPRPSATPSASADNQANAKDRAHVFNEDGFFPSTQSPFAEDGEDPATPHAAASQRHRLSFTAPFDEMSGPVADAEPQPRPPRPDEGGARASGGPVSPAGLANRPAQPRTAGWAMPQQLDPVKAAPPDLSAELDAEGRAPIHTPRNPSSAEGSLNVRVRLAPDGESLSIRLGRLSLEQRARLRLEIAQLLARHGLTAAEIRLNGEIEPEREL